MLLYCLFIDNIKGISEVVNAFSNDVKIHSIDGIHKY